LHFVWLEGLFLLSVKRLASKPTIRKDGHDLPFVLVNILNQAARLNVHKVSQKNAKAFSLANYSSNRRKGKALTRKELPESLFVALSHLVGLGQDKETASICLQFLLLPDPGLVELAHKPANHRNG
jgi:hypothetical protein